MSHGLKASSDLYIGTISRCLTFWSFNSYWFFHTKSAKCLFFWFALRNEWNTIYLFTYRQNWDARVRNFQCPSLKSRTLESDHMTLESVHSTINELELRTLEFSVSASSYFQKNPMIISFHKFSSSLPTKTCPSLSSHGSVTSTTQWRSI